MSKELEPELTNDRHRFLDGRLLIALQSEPTGLVTLGTCAQMALDVMPEYNGELSTLDVVDALDALAHAGFVEVDYTSGEVFVLPGGGSR